MRRNPRMCLSLPCGLILAALVFAYAPEALSQGEPGPQALLAAALDLPSETMTADLEATVYSPSGEVRVVNLTMARKKTASSDAVVYRAVSPAEAAGTAFLSSASGSGKDAQVRRWIFRPGKGQPESLDSKDARKGFLDTDFPFESLDRRYVDFPNLTILGRPNIDGVSTFLIEAFPPDDKKKLGTMRFWVRADSPVLIKYSKYDKKERPVYTFRALNLEKSGEVWTALKWELKNDAKGSYTIINLKNVKYGASIDDSVFLSERLGKP